MQLLHAGCTWARLWRPTQEVILQVDGPIYAQRGAELRQAVQALVRRGERAIQLSLSDVPAIDAAGLGELVRAYNVAAAANGVLRLTDTSRRVRLLLGRVGLLDLLTDRTS